MMSVRMLGALAIVAGCVSVSAPTFAQTAQSKSCTERATGLTAAERATFLRKCSKGALSPTHPTAPITGGPNAKAITAPSGVDRTTRSAQCSAEADRRGLKDNARADFRMSCLATAGPIKESESSTKSAAPSKAKAHLGEVDSTSPH